MFVLLIDDNFIFNKGLKACESFLNHNPNYVDVMENRSYTRRLKKNFYLLNFIFLLDFIIQV